LEGFKSRLEEVLQGGLILSILIYCICGGEEKFSLPNFLRRFK